MLHLSEFRDIILSNMPYDTGFMFLEGASFYETENFLLCSYQTSRVPYIIYNEEGTRYSTKNQYFIRDKTVGDLMRHAAYNASGMQAPRSTLDERIKRRGSTDVIKQGAMDKIRSDYRAEYF